jgi:hypothetical protein
LPDTPNALTEIYTANQQCLDDFDGLSPLVRQAIAAVGALDGDHDMHFALQVRQHAAKVQQNHDRIDRVHSMLSALEDSPEPRMIKGKAKSPSGSARHHFKPGSHGVEAEASRADDLCRIEIDARLSCTNMIVLPLASCSSAERRCPGSEALPCHYRHGLDY